ncbi:MAG: DUF1800 domain-containing protein [Acidimicrobiia bacterium]
MAARADVSERERTAHVLRRLSMGPHPDLLADLATPDDAMEAALDLSVPPAPAIEVPQPSGDMPDVSEIIPPIVWWLERMRTSERLIEERLVWFWHDHFATAVSKVRVPYLMYRQHLTLREHATGNFATLLKAIVRDPAMLIYLDGISNRVDNVNENFGRECLELFTLGKDTGYTQEDVVAMSRASTGWLVKIPVRARLSRLPGSPYDAVFVPQLHDPASVTLLGTTGGFDLDGALDVVLARPETAQFVAGKLYRELTGLDADTDTVERLGAQFAADYEILGLVRAIASEPAFLSDASVRARVRTPVEKLVTVLQATGTPANAGQATRRQLKQGTGGAGGLVALRALGYVPFNPPNVGGYPKGSRLLGPHQLIHAFDLLGAVGGPPPEAAGPGIEPLFARLGVFDISDSTRRAVRAEADSARRFALAFGSPEVVLT